MYLADALSRLAFKIPATSGNVLLSLAEGSRVVQNVTRDPRTGFPCNAPR